MNAIECVSAASVALPPLIIFKTKHKNISWNPECTPANWQFSTSSSGWASNYHGYEWLRSIFKPLSRPESSHLRCLLTADGHSSYAAARVVTSCIDCAIVSIILLLCCSYELQPLNYVVFALLKRALARETDNVARLGFGTVEGVSRAL
jgi:hypothetical protein